MAPEPDVEATFRRAVAIGTVSLSIIRKGRILDQGDVRYEDSLLNEGDWVEVRTTDGRYWWGRCVGGHFQLRAWRWEDDPTSTEPTNSRGRGRAERGGVALGEDEW